MILKVIANIIKISLLIKIIIYIIKLKIIKYLFTFWVEMEGYSKWVESYPQYGFKNYNIILIFHKNYLNNQYWLTKKDRKLNIIFIPYTITKFEYTNQS